MTLLYSSKIFGEHDTGDHPERAERLQAIDLLLERHPKAEECLRPDWEPASIEELSRVHDLDYLKELEQFATAGGGQIEPDTVLSSKSWEVARLASGAAIDATRRVVSGEDSQALCLLRPPGHHALAAGAMGFCLVNHIAVAAKAALEEHQLNRVLIVDWDVHHGNGTQDAFYEHSEVGFFSIHRSPFYPGTGEECETGRNEGLGTTRNLPMAIGVSRDRYLSHFARELQDFADLIRPELVLLSAGFDSHNEDPVGSIGLETEDFEILTAAVLDVAATHCEGRVVSVLEGGYNPKVLAECVATHLDALSLWQS